MLISGFDVGSDCISSWSLLIFLLLIRACGVTAYIVYRDVRKIWGGFLDSDYKYECGILANNYEYESKTIVIFRLKRKKKKKKYIYIYIYIYVQNLTKIINVGLKIILSGL